MRTLTPAQPDLLDWQPPEVVTRFEERHVRAATIQGRVCMAVAAALSDAAAAGQDRASIAKAMTDFLGEPVSKNMLDAYASQARAEHMINVPRFIALIQATQDRRLLELLAEMFGWAVIPREMLPLIRVAAIREREEELRDQRRALMREVGRGHRK